MLNGLGNDLLYTAYQLTTTFNKCDGSPIPGPLNGTAFFVENDRKKLCLVTNRHMLDLEYNNKNFVGAKLASIRIEGFKSLSGDNYQVPIERVVRTVSIDKYTNAHHSSEDVACIINPVVIGENAQPTAIDFSIDSTYLATDEWFEKNLTVCDFVAFPGYPPWHDKLENRPILRTGFIASDPRTNYSDQAGKSKGRRIAYEALSFGGSSGSPVFAVQKGYRFANGGGTSEYREGKFIGINAGHFNTASKVLPATKEGQQVTQLGQHSGISYLIKSSVILDLIQGKED